MRRIVKAILFATFYILVFVAIPNIALGFLPREALEMIAMMGIDVGWFLVTFAWIGLTLAAMSFVKNMTDSWTYLHLLALLISALIGFYLELFLFGLGDPAGFGVTRRFIRVGPPEEPVTTTLFLDFRFITAIIALATVLEIVKEVLTFYSSRRKHFATVD